MWKSTVPEHNYNTDNNRTKIKKRLNVHIVFKNISFVVQGLKCERLCTVCAPAGLLTVNWNISQSCMFFSHTDSIGVKQHVEHMKAERSFSVTVRDMNEQLQVFSSCLIYCMLTSKTESDNLRDDRQRVTWADNNVFQEAMWTMIARAFLSQEADGKQMAAVNQTAALTEADHFHRFVDLLCSCSPHGMLCSVSLNSWAALKRWKREESVLECVCTAVNQHCNDTGRWSKGNRINQSINSAPSSMNSFVLKPNNKMYGAPKGTKVKRFCLVNSRYFTRALNDWLIIWVFFCWRHQTVSGPDSTVWLAECVQPEVLWLSGNHNL